MVRYYISLTASMYEYVCKPLSHQYLTIHNSCLLTQDHTGQTAGKIYVDYISINNFLLLCDNEIIAKL